MKKGFILIRTLYDKNLVNAQRGFTLIELLVVIAILGILVAIGVNSYSGIDKRAKDTQRKSDIKQYQAIIESFANQNNGLYPLYTDSAVQAYSTCLGGGFGNVEKCPIPVGYDSLNDTFDYFYISDANQTHFVFYSRLETTWGNYWVVCSSGTSGEFNGNITEATTGGVCPI